MNIYPLLNKDLQLLKEKKEKELAQIKWFQFWNFAKRDLLLQDLHYIARSYSSTGGIIVTEIPTHLMKEMGYEE